MGGCFYLARKNMSKEEIVAAIKECAEKLGRAPSQPELRGLCPSINMGMIRKFLGSYTQALEESGFAGEGCGYEATMDDLFRDWAQIVRKMGKVPTMTEYDRESRYSVRPLMGRLRSWKQVPRGLHKYAEQSKLDVEFADVLDIITRHYEGNPEAAWILERTTENKAGYAPIMPDRPVYGPPLSPIHLAYGPTNEAGVLFLFAMMAGSLGFVVTRIQSEFPDCEALRQVGEERYQMARIEFEYESRNFVKHFHDAAKCDIIVCWTHNWPECPLEVIELKGKVPKLG
jgi:Homing endonuclease associated repeat